MNSTLILSQNSEKTKLMTNLDPDKKKFPVEVIWEKMLTIDYDNILKVRYSLKVEVDSEFTLLKNVTESGIKRVDLVLLKLGKVPYETAESTLKELNLQFADAAELTEFTRYFNSEVFNCKNYLIVAMKQFKDVGHVYKLHPSLEGHPRHYSLGLSYRALIAETDDVIYLAKRVTN